MKLTILKNMGNNRFLIFIYVFLFVLIGVAGYMVVRDSQRSIDRYDDISKTSVRKLELLVNIRKNVDYIQIATLRHFIDSDQTSRNADENIMKVNQEMNNLYWDEYKTLIRSPKEQALFDTLTMSRAANAGTMAGLMKETYVEGITNTAAIYYYNQIQKAAHENYQNAISKLSDYIVQENDSRIKGARSFMLISRSQIDIFLGVAFVLLIILAVMITRTLRALNKHNRLLEEHEKQLEAHNKDLEQFAYIVSHNLRGPLANIMTITEALGDRKLNKLEKADMLSGLSKSVNRLDTAILDLNQILNVKRQNGEKRELVHFSNLVDDIKSDIKSIIEKEHADIKTDFSAINELVTLKGYISSIFYNLISNSIKYHQPDVPPHIEIKSEVHDHKIILKFRDNGLGIDLVKKRDQLFGLYKRFHNHVDGKGMGLFMVKAQVETLGGKINVNSEVNRGTEFTLEFDR